MEPRHDETQNQGCERFQPMSKPAGYMDATVEREPLKKLAIDEHALLNLLRRWRAEAEKQGHRITRIAVAFEAGPDGFWLARWLATHGVEAHVIHASSVAVTRE